MQVYCWHDDVSGAGRRNDWQIRSRTRWRSRRRSQRPSFYSDRQNSSAQWFGCPAAASDGPPAYDPCRSCAAFRVEFELALASKNLFSLAAPSETYAVWLQ